MINDALKGKFDVIITKSNSRFARNTLDCLKYVRCLKEKGVSVYFEKENINTMDSKGKVRVNHTRFLGYDKDENGELIIVPKEAKIIKRIYEEYLAGYGTNKICRNLERDGIKTPTGRKKWWDSTIRSILKNEKYMGDALLQKSLTVDFLTKKRVKK